MCLAVPVKITEFVAPDMARCQVGEGQTYITASTMLLPEPADVGEYIIVHAGFALRKLETADAEETLALLREIIAASRPEDFC